MSRTAVVGLGLIGGSIALALSARGWDRDSRTRERARVLGIDARESPAEALVGAEVVFLAVPTTEVAGLLASVAAQAPADAVLTDAASLKRPVVAAARTLPASRRFVGGHPLAGGRAPGLEGVQPGLFRDRPWALVPTERCDAAAIDSVARVVRSLGARPLEMDADRHDALMTRIIQLPLAVSAALARGVGGTEAAEIGSVAGPGLLDTTRLAGGPIALAEELVLADPPALAAALEAVSEDLRGLARSLRGLDAAAVRAFFEEARMARSQFADRAAKS